jgi:hypothetical protein
VVVILAAQSFAGIGLNNPGDSSDVLPVRA